MRRATRKGQISRAGIGISIHALLAESDDIRPPNLSSISDFYPRSPCGERLSSIDDLEPSSTRISIHALLAESDDFTGSDWVLDFPISIHALLAESDVGASEGADIEHISIHALLAESDPPGIDLLNVEILFLSTLSLRRATTTIITICTA